ncbi:hypothetical protein [Pseudoflavonifractor sp. An85]|uniref:hypothetical protein n=1 Tax=Pseudoflavonifractor sp. An85 TaxID=1965661 RepID=UPI000B3756B0|nr:hypothetical protein [Pseudoflavonifractor sp. An85]OUN25018.1 hypothetical protein B5G37_04995 [Pseudoflavonifractor sp. An85]
MLRKWMVCLVSLCILAAALPIHAPAAATSPPSDFSQVCPNPSQLEQEILSQLTVAYENTLPTLSAPESEKDAIPTSVDFSTAIPVYIDTELENLSLVQQVDIQAHLEQCVSVWVIPMQVGSLYATVTLAKGLPLNPETAHLMTPEEQASVQEKEGAWTVSEVAMYTDFTPYSTQISQLEQAGITTEDAVLVGGLPGIRMPMLLLFENDIASYWYPMGDYGPSVAEVTDTSVREAMSQDETLHPFYNYEAVLAYAKTNQTSTQTDSSGMPNGSTSQGPTLVDFAPLLVAGAFLILVLLVALWVFRRGNK